MSEEKLSKYKDLAGLFEGWLQGSTSEEGSRLASVSSYSLRLPGKRLRPVLCLASAELLNIAPELIRPVSLAIEYVHTFSLIHDDLPALDNDTLRRGQPTAHIKYDEASALLAGDRLQAEAFRLLAESEQIAPETRVRLLSALSSAVVELCDGQMMDLEASALSDGGEAEELAERHAKKTAALISFSAYAPALMLPEEQIEPIKLALNDFGQHLGLLFQITDDILDETSSTEELGKDSSSDRRRGTPTYLSVYGLESAKRLAEEHAEGAKAALSSFGDKASFFSWLADYVLQRKS